MIGKTMIDKNKKILLAIYLILIISLGYFAFSSFRYRIFYEEAIKQGAENLVVSLEMLEVCKDLGNITNKDIIRGYVNRFMIKEAKQ